MLYAPKNLYNDSPVSKTTPSDEYTWESWLPVVVYTGEERLLSGQYNGKSRGGEDTGESITNTENSTNIRLNSTSFDYEYEELHEYSTKVAIVFKHIYWHQEK